MGGYAKDKKPKRMRHVSSHEVSRDPCDLEFALDLVGLQPDVSCLLRVDDELQVELFSIGAATSVVCKIPNGHIVGTLAAFRGLAQLITCLQQGVEYKAFVLFASVTRCAVHVARVEA